MEKIISLLKDVLVARMKAFSTGGLFDIESTFTDPRWLMLGEICKINTAKTEDSLLPLIALVPHLYPGFFESVITGLMPQGGELPEFGGIKGQNHRGMLPTGETALFILYGTNIQERIQAMRRWHSEVCDVRKFVYIDKVKDGEPVLGGMLIPDADWLENLLHGQDAQPQFSTSFPAKRINTPMLWTDLVLHPKTAEQVQDIRLWMEHNSTVLNDKVLSRKVKPGYRVLFYGPAGTGKTLTASLLGNEFGLPVYRIDLSQVVSKFIGETEKNLELVFERASRKNWILFFDEADALFGKRTSVSSAHDKYANQEVSYLLQRIEDHEGLLILASNYRNNIDEAFLRRFHNIIHFPMPGAAERQQLWQGCVPERIATDPAINWQQIAAAYELTGAAIVNIMQFVSIKALSRNDNIIRQTDIVEGIRREFKKEEKNI